MSTLIGLLFGLAIIGLGYLTRQGRAIPFYSTMLIVIAVGFIALAVVGARWSRRREAGGLIAAGLVLHGGFDLAHDALIHNPAVPPWWPVFCAIVDIVVGGWLIGLMVRLPHSALAPSGREASPEE